MKRCLLDMVLFLTFYFYVLLLLDIEDAFGN